MKNNVRLTIFLLFLFHAALAQINQDDYSMHWYNNGKNDTLPSILTATRTSDNYFLEEDYKNKTLDSLFHDKAFCQHRPPGSYYVQIGDLSIVHFFARRITSVNCGEYEYRILLNARTPVVPWRPVPYSTTTIPDPDKTAVNLNGLGAYKSRNGNYLLIDLRKKGSDSIISYAVVFWRQPIPVPEIKKYWYQTLAFKIAEGILIAAFLGFILLLWLNYRNKRKFRAEQQKKERLENDIRALRAQLNPHFIFNALGSIQGLINNGEGDSANNYLSDFARLMRDVLNENNNEYNVLEHEIQILESYLKLERLRFQFNFNINIAQTIQVSVVQVPALLLQPLVENAVKHGVAVLQERGQIDISFEQINNDMVVHITDNGPGFDTADTPYGYGLQLTKRRITFANEISGTQFIFMKIKSGKGTCVTITYQNWLA